MRLGNGLSNGKVLAAVSRPEPPNRNSQNSNHREMQGGWLGSARHIYQEILLGANTIRCRGYGA